MKKAKETFVLKDFFSDIAFFPTLEEAEAYKKKRHERTELRYGQPIEDTSYIEKRT